jgi:hypothetical protein
MQLSGELAVNTQRLVTLAIESLLLSQWVDFIMQHRNGWL